MQRNTKSYVTGAVVFHYYHFQHVRTAINHRYFMGRLPNLLEILVVESRRPSCTWINKYRATFFPCIKPRNLLHFVYIYIYIYICLDFQAIRSLLSVCGYSTLKVLVRMPNLQQYHFLKRFFYEKLKLHFQRGTILQTIYEQLEPNTNFAAEYMITIRY